MENYKLALWFFVAIELVGCGGGGAAPSSPATQTAPAPTVSLSIDQSRVKSGQSANLTWTSTNATSCTASGAWTGSQSTSGSISVTPSSSGKFAYTLTCSGAGGNGNQSVSLTVPIPVARSSYENKIQAGEILGPQAMPSEVASGNAVTYADFFQDGSYSMVTHTLEYIPDWSQTEFGHIHFYRRNASGNWIDKTSDLLTNTVGCLHPRKAVVADFNGDGKPDVFFACHGYDRSPYPGESPHVLFSQPDGTYKNVTLPINCFCHGASTVDYAGNGYADIVVTDNIIAGIPYFLINNGDGTFTADQTRLPSSLQSKAIFSAELIDFDKTGKYDLWLGGNEPGATANETTTAYDIAPTIFKNDGSNKYATSAQIALPTNPDYGLPLDIVFKNGAIHLLRTNIGGGPNNYGLSSYTTAAIQKIDYSTLTSSMPYVHTGQYSNGMAWVNWIMSYGGKVVSMNNAYQIGLNN